MNYQEQLSPWVIHQLLPNLSQSTVARFRRRIEAESYLKAIQQMRPSAQFAIAFDIAPPGTSKLSTKSAESNIAKATP